MPALICGSLAYDSVMVFQGRFKEHILPDKIHILNVSFMVPQLRRNFGGCAGNIGYNLKLLGGAGAIMATCGRDFGDYRRWLQDNAIGLDYVRELEQEFTAQAYITTDLDDNQITAFHPGAMNFSHLNEVPIGTGFDIGIVSPDGRDGMLRHAEQFAAANIPFIFDPGQGLPMFDGAALMRFIEQAAWITVNDYEAELLIARTGKTLQQLAALVRALIVTQGGKGSTILAGGQEYKIPTAKPAAILDPTGCGDAYRAGLLHGLMKKWDWNVTGRVASLMGAIKIEHHGPQNHRFTAAEFAARFKREFNQTLPV
jgi:adenosine kinase